MKPFLCFLLIPVMLFAQQEPELTAVETELIQFNENLFREYAIYHKIDLFEKTVKDDYVLVAATGHLESKEFALKGVKNIMLTSLEVTTDKVIVNDEIGIVVGVLKMEGTIMKRPIPNDFRFMSVFVKEDGMWKLQTRSMTPIQKWDKP